MNPLGQLFGSVNVFDIAFGLYKTQGEDAARRFLTPPRSFVQKVCKKTGADFTKAMEERDEAVDEMLEFLESMVDKDFIDPDPN